MDASEWWFGACVQAMDGYSAAGANILVNREMDGDLVLTLKAYQLLHTSSFMSQHEYIHRSQGRDFADLLWAQICGTELPKVVEILNDVMSPGLTRDRRELRLARHHEAQRCRKSAQPTGTNNILYLQ